MAIRYMSTNSFESEVGDIFGVCQKTVSNVLFAVVRALDHPDVVARFMRFYPDSEQWCAKRAAEFAQQCKFSNIIGAIDGCLIKVQQPCAYGWQYFCLKACSAVNMVAIVDARGRARLFEDGCTAPGYRLIGDSGFRNSASIVTPFREAAARDDERKPNFDDEHSHARVVVEQAFGALKRRFPILYNVARPEPPKLQMVVVACVILYKIGVILGAQNGQPLSGRMRPTVPHPPPDVQKRQCEERGVE
ncbi:hypothetical protein Aduo_011759 [Ancylostoma duodenale]